MDIGPGCVVECVKYLGIVRGGGTQFTGPPLVVGRMYTVERFSSWPRAVAVVEIQRCPHTGLRFVYDINCFRKRPPHREALFRSLLEPTQQITEDA